MAFCPTKLNVVLLLFASTMTLAQGLETTRNERPCALHPVNGRMCVNEAILRSLLLKYVPPKFPKDAAENGDVVLHVIIPPTGGKATKIAMVSGDPALGRSAVRAVREWAFMAYVYKRNPVEVEGDLHISFSTPE